MRPNTQTPFQTIRDACATTGLSMYYLRQGVKAGTIPHLRSGEKYLINVPLLMEKLDAESRRGTAS